MSAGKRDGGSQEKNDLRKKKVLTVEDLLEELSLFEGRFLWVAGGMRGVCQVQARWFQ